MYICIVIVNQRLMNKTLSELQRISDNLEQTGKDLREMEKVWAAELKDRLAKGITGNAAVQHYNEWMIKAGMEHLITKDNGKTY